MLKEVYNRIRYLLRKKWFKSKYKKLTGKYPEKNIDIIQISINNYKLLIIPNNDIGKQIIINKKFEYSDTLFLEKVIKPDWNCIDIGANIGYYSLLFAKNARNGNIYAIDPIKHHCLMIELSAVINKCNNIKISNVAISDTNGKVKFTEAVDGAFSSIKDTRRKAVAKRMEVDCMTLDYFVENSHISDINLIKIDVEGAEDLVLKGANNVLSKLRPDLFLVEMYNTNLQIYGSDVKNILELMRKYEYECYYCNEHKLVPYRENDYSRCVNAYFIHVEKKSLFSQWFKD
jgi:FkbM family methyltransferase